MKKSIGVEGEIIKLSVGIYDSHLNFLCCGNGICEEEKCV